MTDPFALLGLPRRPWLDEETVRAAFQKRARELHPDASGGDVEAFAALNAAHAAVSRPAERLKLLLEGAALPCAPPDVAFAFGLAAALRLADEVARKRQSTTNAITRALIASEVAAAASRLSSFDEELSRMEAVAVERLKSLDSAWPKTEGLAELAATFVFLARWRAQLRERRQALM